MLKIISLLTSEVQSSSTFMGNGYAINPSAYSSRKFGVVTFDDCITACIGDLGCVYVSIWPACLSTNSVTCDCFFYAKYL